MRVFFVDKRNLVCTAEFLTTTRTSFWKKRLRPTQRCKWASFWSSIHVRARHFVKPDLRLKVKYI